MSEKKSETADPKDSNFDPNKETILIAEDSAPNRKILAHLIEKLGFQVVACENGKAAWDELNSGRCSKIVAVISDIMMPEMDGVTFLRTVRGDEKAKALPFILVTAVSDKDYIVQAKELNVNGYILKPVTFQRVTAKMQELFPGKTFPKLAA